uniref:DUF834 domain-containing protein n=1 Tax=Oryza nivara TaxID=4536 RepID=A0A0E0GCC8_ORYNI
MWSSGVGEEDAGAAARRGEETGQVSAARSHLAGASQWVRGVSGVGDLRGGVGWVEWDKGQLAGGRRPVGEAGVQRPTTGDEAAATTTREQEGLNAGRRLLRARQQRLRARHRQA